MRIIKKLRLYLETTVFNYYFDEDRPGHEDVLRLFEAIKAGKFEVYTSELVMRELERAQEPKRSDMLALTEKYKLKTLLSRPDVEILAELYIERGIIPVSHLFDSLHVAMASAYEIDCIISYNFHHINRNKTRILATMVNNEEGYGGITIATAKEVLDYE
ncbi:MAG: PIN domain-containing protein [Synergistaceae bacterium]|nr:PIN domain-containing protein [Synergistaceae bacterium]